MADKTVNVATSLVMLDFYGVPKDVQKMLVHGDADRGIKAGALAAALRDRYADLGAANLALREAAGDIRENGPSDGRYRSGDTDLSTATRYTLADIAEVFGSDEEFVRAVWLDVALKRIVDLEAKINSRAAVKNA